MDSEAETLDTFAESDQSNGETSGGVVVDRGGVAVVEAGEPSGDEYFTVHRGDERQSRKASKDEIEKRVRTCERLFLQGKPKSQILAVVKRLYGVRSGMAENYLRRARRNIELDQDISRVEYRAINLRCYRRFVDAPDVPPRDKIRALERIDKILGLEAPIARAVTVTGADGGPIEHRSEQSVAVVVAGVDLSGRLADVGSRVRGAAVQALLDHVKDAADNGESLPVIDVTPDAVKVSD